MSTSSEQGETDQPRAVGELGRRRPGLVAGVALIAPGRIPAGLDLGSAELCRHLGECLLDPDADPAMIVARSQGYAVLALASGLSPIDPDAIRTLYAQFTEAEEHCASSNDVVQLLDHRFVQQGYPSVLRVYPAGGAPGHLGPLAGPRSESFAVVRA